MLALLLPTFFHSCIPPQQNGQNWARLLVLGLDKTVDFRILREKFQHILYLNRIITRICFYFIQKWFSKGNKLIYDYNVLFVTNVSRILLHKKKWIRRRAKLFSLSLLNTSFILKKLFLSRIDWKNLLVFDLHELMWRKSIISYGLYIKLSLERKEFLFPLFFFLLFPFFVRFCLSPIKIYQEVLTKTRIRFFKTYLGLSKSSDAGTLFSQADVEKNLSFFTNR
jgi:hypothetical protein